MVCHIRAKRREDGSVLPLNLPIRLGMVCGCKAVMNAHHLADALKERRSEALAIVGDEVLGGTVIETP